MMRVVLIAVVLASASLLSAASADAQDMNRARTLFEEGVEAAQAERFEQAVQLFRDSLAIVERPSTLFNLALALESLGRFGESARVLDQYTRSAGARDASRRDAEALRTRLAARVAIVTVRVTPPNAVLELDGEPVPGDGAVRELSVDPGAHTLSATAPGHRAETAPINVQAGGRAEQTLTLDAEQQEEAEEQVVEEPEPPAAPPPSGGGGLGELGLIGIIIGGVGVAAGIVSLATGLVTISTYDQLVASCGADMMSCPAGSEGDIEMGTALSWTSTITLGVAIAGIAVGVTLLALDLSTPKESAQAASLELRVRPNGAEARLRF